jgi:hypothetical protein
MLAASTLMLTVLMPGDADAQGRGFRGGGPRGGGMAFRAAGPRRVMAVGPRYRGGYRRGRGWGWGAAGVGLGLGALAVGAAAAPYYYGSPYGYETDPCLRRQRFWNGYGYQWQWVQVC